jgi:hypothetical protein
MADWKRYKVEDPDTARGFFIEIDREKVTDETFHLINGFWSGADDRIEEADGDVLLAVLRLLWEEIMRLSIETFDVESKLAAGIEGWPRFDGTMGFRLVHYDEWEFDSSGVAYEEQPATATAGGVPHG